MVQELSFAFGPRDGAVISRLISEAGLQSPVSAANGVKFCSLSLALVQQHKLLSLRFCVAVGLLAVF
jgi:hypothetical protein